jgi:hypothetical protein
MAKTPGGNNIAAIIYAAATNYAKKSGYEFGDGSADAMERYAQQAAQVVERGESNVQDFTPRFYWVIDHMIDASRTIPDYARLKPGVIGEQTLVEALSALQRLQLCPFPPFC